MTEEASCSSNGHLDRSEGHLWKDVQESGWQNVWGHLQGMHIAGVLAEFGEYASDGDLWVNGSSEKGLGCYPRNSSVISAWNYVNSNLSPLGTRMGIALSFVREFLSQQSINLPGKAIGRLYIRLSWQLSEVTQCVPPSR